MHTHIHIYCHCKLLKHIHTSYVLTVCENLTFHFTYVYRSERISKDSASKLNKVNENYRSIVAHKDSKLKACQQRYIRMYAIILLRIFVHIGFVHTKSIYMHFSNMYYKHKLFTVLYIVYNISDHLHILHI